MGFLQSVLFVECLCYNSDIIILPDNMKAGGMLYEMMALSDRGGGGRRQYGGGRRVDTADRDALLETAVARARPETASMV
mgnify:CR=1 FL=1